MTREPKTKIQNKTESNMFSTFIKKRFSFNIDTFFPLDIITPRISPLGDVILIPSPDINLEKVRHLFKQINFQLKKKNFKKDLIGSTLLVMMRMWSAYFRNLGNLLLKSHSHAYSQFLIDYMHFNFWFSGLFKNKYTQIANFNCFRVMGFTEFVTFCFPQWLMGLGNKGCADI